MLSLGLVGALSIVRFRTPIKEPLELVFIFVAIALGLGIGANQLMPTLIGFACIVLLLLPSVFSSKTAVTEKVSSYVNISFSTLADKPFVSTELTDFLNSLSMKYRLKRISESSAQNNITILAPSLSLDNYEKIKEFANAHYSDVQISIIDNTKTIT